MDAEHRAQIAEFMHELVKVRDLDAIMNEIERRKISHPDMIARVKAEALAENRNLAELFFRHIQRRGPSAFMVLVQTLHLTGNAQQANLLDQDSMYYISEEQMMSKLSISSPSGIETPSLSQASSTSSLSFLSPRPRNRHGNHIEFQSPDLDQISDYSDTDESKQPLKIVVKKATLYNEGKTAGCYQMMSKPKGFALIVNIINFEGDPGKMRLGAEHDSNNLEILLSEFGFEVTTHLDVRKKKLLDPEIGILKRFTDQFHKTDVDCCFVAVMSHGDDDFFIDTADPPSFNRINNRVHLWDDIITPFFNNEAFKVFYGKPKVFLIQACRGHNDNVGTNVEMAGRILRQQAFSDTSSLAPAAPVVPQVPRLNHVFILQSTIPGYKAMRDSFRGSWFIECVCGEFMKHAWNHSLEELYRKVAAKLERLITMEGNMQTCDFHGVGFGMKLYFNPGLCVADCDENLDLEGASGDV